MRCLGVEVLPASRCSGVSASWPGLFLLAIGALGTAFLSLQSVTPQPDGFLTVKAGGGGSAAVLEELARLRSEVKASALDHYELGLRMAGIERLTKQALSNTELLLQVAQGQEPKQKVKGATQAAGATSHATLQLNGTDKGRGVEIAIVTDEAYLHKFYRQVLAMRCYAWRHGYAFTLLNSNPHCGQADFFFRKHCTVARYLSTTPVRHTMVILDGDVVPAALGRRLDSWLSGPEDLIFYEREWSPEVAAGNYVVRNTAFSQRFLHEWAKLEAKKPPSGIFSGADNGAIHVLIPDALGVPCADRVAKLYGSLSHIGVNKSDISRIPLEYKHFVAVAELIRGPPRRWVNVSRWQLQGDVTVLPRIHAWVADHHATQSKGSDVGSVFHHGVKTQEEMARYFSDTGLQRCTPLPQAMVDRSIYLSTMQRYLAAIRDHYGNWHLPSGRPVPFHEAVMHCCMHDLSCRPLGPGEALPLGGGQTYKDPFVAAAAAGPAKGTAGGATSSCSDPEAPPAELPPC